MKTIKRILLVTMTTVLMSAAVPVKDTYKLDKDYIVTINGTSNLHSWNEKVETVTGEGSINWNADGSFDLNAITIRMNVHSIQSTEGSVMNGKTYKALKGDANPEIVFTLSEAVKAVKAEPTAENLAAKGNLTIAGKTNPVVMQVKVFMKDKGKLAFEGSQIIKMSDYDIDPPTALFGMLKTGNEITINFVTRFTVVLNN